MPRNRKQNEDIKNKRRQAIILTALDFFITKGIDGTKIDNIASKLGISHGLFYHYYSNKNDLLKDVIIYSRSVIFKNIDLDEKDPEKYISNMTKNFTNLLKDKNDARTLCFFLDLSYNTYLNTIFKDVKPEKNYVDQLKDSFNELEHENRLTVASGKEAFFRDITFFIGYSRVTRNHEGKRPIVLSCNTINSLFIKVGV